MYKKQSINSANKPRKIKSNHRFSFIDPLALILFAALSQPLGQWLLKYLLDEIKELKYVNHLKLLISLASFILGSILGITWYKFSRRKA